MDDELVAHDIIKGYCDMLPSLQLSKNCYNAIEAIEFLSSNKVDLIFLDINLPKISGFDFLRTMINSYQIIVTTAYQEFALEGYELNVTDYLLKPFSFERFLKAINKTKAPTKQSITTAIVSNPASKSLFLKTDKRYSQIAINEILYAEASGNYSKIITSNKHYTVREKFSELKSNLSKIDFIQVHKSFLVSVKYIDSIEGNQIRIGKHIIPIGKVHKTNINSLLKR